MVNYLVPKLDGFVYIRLPGVYLKPNSIKPWSFQPFRYAFRRCRQRLLAGYEPAHFLIETHAGETPGKRLLALSMQPWHGMKHPSSAELAAFTMASAARRGRDRGDGGICHVSGTSVRC